MSATHSQSGRLPRVDHKNGAASWLNRLRTRAARLRARLAPPDPVLLLRADGTRSVWLGDDRLEQAEGRKTPKFLAVEIPDDLLLRRSLPLPRMSASDVEEALLLEVRSNSPFAPDDLAWGCVVRDADDGQQYAEIVIASRRLISEFIHAKWPDLPAGGQPEVWAVAGLPGPVVITGYGEQRRQRHSQSQQRWDWALLFLALALASVAAITPTAQLRLRALEAADAFEGVMKRVAPLVRKRDEIALLNDRLRSLDAAVADRVDPAQVLEYLTQILPDDTHLYALDIRKEKITASGHTVDASALLQKLSSDPRLKDVRSPTAVTRVPGAAKEAFTVEFTMDMTQAAVGASFGAGKTNGVATTVASQPAPVASAAAAPSAPAASSVSNGVAAAPPQAAASVPRPAANGGSSPFVVGGSAR
jgi:general secretion pathway protein L